MKTKLDYEKQRRGGWENLARGYTFATIVIALAAIGAGVCPTAKKAEKNCGGSAEPSCFVKVDVPCKSGPLSVICCKISTPSDDKPGICGDPFDKTTTCGVTSNHVVTLYQWFQPVTNASGACICSTITIDKCTQDVPCPITYQTTDQDDCVRD